MSLKKLFGVLKQDGYLIPAIDSYLLTHNAESSEDRGHDYVSPSSIHNCLRSQLYRILGYPTDGKNEPRTQRIFDNGTDMHVRNQKYLTGAGILIFDEAPIFNAEYKVAGHTDGLLQLNELTLAILELKSINSDGFRGLHAEKPEHNMQAQAYMLFTELLRLELNRCKTKLAFIKLKKKKLAEYRAFMEGFVHDGRRFTKEEKMRHSLECYEKLMNILYKCQKKIDTMIFLYENKDNQDQKEYIVKWNDEVVESIKNTCKEIDKYRKRKKVPSRPKEVTGKSCQVCRYCKYKVECYN
jgi:hypothetical protein